MATTKKHYKFPKTMGACADRLYKIRTKKKEAKAALAEVENEEKALKAHIIDNLPKSEASGIAGKLARVTVVKKEAVQVKDWDAFYKYLKRTNGFDMIQRRVSDAAVKARLEDGKKVPGIELFSYPTVSMNKV